MPSPVVRIRNVVELPLILADGRQAKARAVTFDGLRDGLDHIALLFGAATGDAPLVRLHSECLTGDAFGSARCDCGPQLQDALRRLSDRGGVLLYLRQEGRGIGLAAKLDAYRLQEAGFDTFAANRAIGRLPDERDYGVAADMLLALKITKLTLLTNNPDKRTQLADHGIAVVAEERTGVFVGPHNRRYLEAKAIQAGHNIALDAVVAWQDQHR